MPQLSVQEESVNGLFTLWRIAASTAILLQLLFCFAVSAVAAKEDPSPPLPIKIPDEQWRPLLQHEGSRLQQRLRQEVKQRLELQRLTTEQKLAIAIVDLSLPEAIEYARINGDVEMYAASLPKIAILLTAFAQFEQGRLERSETLNNDLIAMIRRSSNRAASRVISQVGGLREIQRVLQDPRHHFYDERQGGGLWVGKYYAQSGKRVPDPLKGITHAATVNQVSRFYYQLATGKLINFDASKEMLQILSSPKIDHKFVKTLRSVAPHARLYRKSGSWKLWHSDSVLVWGPKWRRYILVALSESSSGERILQELVLLAEKILQERATP
ncbi:MAG: serine hydrolase [Gammaproteobacteria bacterium]|nr:serine hydrolase [Gammaproteobacteria bacterium]